MMKTLFTTVFLIMMLVLSGCAQDNTTNGKPITESKPTTKTNPNNETNSTNIKATGTYIGLADPHTIEIELPDGPKAFQIDPDKMSEFEKIPAGTSINFQYVKNEHNQLVLIKLQDVNQIVKCGTE